MLLSLSLLLGILLISNWMGTGSASRSHSQEIIRSLSALAFLAVSAALLLLISSTNTDSDHGNNRKVSYKYMGSCYQRYSPVDIVCKQSRIYTDAAAKDF